MTKRALLASALLMLGTAGCQSLWGSHRMADSGLRATHGREEPALKDPWVNEAGNIARKEHTPEEIHDPLGLRNYFTSEKARSIERNVGIGP
jgi:hypothetical protein